MGCLRAEQLCGLRFRRQHPIEPWIVDFACPHKMLVVEVDGSYHDNIVVFWRPSQPIPAQSEERRTYRLHWCWTPPVTPLLATTADTRVGAGLEKGTRLFAIDFVGGRLTELTQDAPVQVDITTSAGTVKHRAAQPNPVTGGWRVSFVLDPAGAKLCDMRGLLKLGEEPLSEVWSYRWTP